jgi:hypothetical protein
LYIFNRNFSLDGRGGTSLIKKELDAYTSEGISLTDPDTNQRSDLVSSLAKRLEKRRVILFQAPSSLFWQNFISPIIGKLLSS